MDPVADFPTCSRVTDLSVLSDDTLLAHVNNCSNVAIYRSADHGATWKRCSPSHNRRTTAR